MKLILFLAIFVVEINGKKLGKYLSRWPEMLSY